MPYTPIEIDRENITIMGVNFSSVSNFKANVNALGAIVFEEFNPSPAIIEIIRDYIRGIITIEQLGKLTKEKAYAQVVESDVIKSTTLRSATIGRRAR